MCFRVFSKYFCVLSVLPKYLCVFGYFLSISVSWVFPKHLSVSKVFPKFLSVLGHFINISVFLGKAYFLSRPIYVFL